MGGTLSKNDNVYLLSAVPLTNYTPNISHLGVTIPCGVTAAIGIAFLLTRLHATSLTMLDNMPVHLSKLSSKRSIYPPHMTWRPVVVI